MIKLTLGDVYFNKKAGRYQSVKGGFLSISDVNGILAAEEKALAVRLENIAARALKNQWDSGELERALKLEVKEAAIQMAVAGAGGDKRVAQMNSKEKGRFYGGISGQLKDTYKRIEKFTKKISKGNLSEAQILARAKSYVNSVTPQFSKAQVFERKNAGVTLAKRLLDPTANHCPACPRYATSDFVPIDEIVPVGVACPCGRHCRCRIVFKSPGFSLGNRGGFIS
jgi:hypothetical protein